MHQQQKMQQKPNGKIQLAVVFFHVFNKYHVSYVHVQLWSEVKWILFLLHVLLCKTAEVVAAGCIFMLYMLSFSKFMKRASKQINVD